MAMGGDSWTQLSSSLAGLMFIITLLKPYFPKFILSYLDNLILKITSYFNNNAQIIFPEYTPGRLNKRSELYLSIELYLCSLATNHAKRLVADMSKKSKKPVLSLDVHEQVIDEFLGVQVEWFSNATKSNRASISLYNTEPEEKRFYKLVFPNRHRDTFTASYIQYVIGKASEISAVNRQRKLYTNTSGGGYGDSWSSVLFEHPASFETLAMDPRKKKEIIDDLKTFSLAKDYYAKIGKAWKRGYLLYGPPGTGKSTMIACIANYLGYDVYDLELTAVKNNIQLRELLIETSSKSVIVIEDVDCSLELTGRRKKKKDEEEGKELKKPMKGKDDKKGKSSEVTLSGLLNSIDGLWSGCGSEKIIIFTTNHLEDLDPALIRTGRMDKHIEMSYCGFEAFKVLAKNYLEIESHCLFEDVKDLLGEVKMTPADVAEHLMPKYGSSNNAADTCLKNLVEALQLAKTEAEAKAGKEEADAKADGKKVAGVLRLKQNLMKMFKRVRDENNKAKENGNGEESEKSRGKENSNGGGKEKGTTTVVAVAA